jgi:hypothetical protein
MKSIEQKRAILLFFVSFSRIFPRCDELFFAHFRIKSWVVGDSGSNAAVNIHSVPIVPAASVIPDVNSVPAVVDLPARFWPASLQASLL